jgi:hypothetical protein
VAGFNGGGLWGAFELRLKSECLSLILNGLLMLNGVNTDKHRSERKC